VAPVYAQRADALAYTEALVIQTGQEAQADRILERAEADVDHACGDWSIEMPSGRKFGDPYGSNPKALTDVQKLALKRATLAQFEFRVEYREKHFIHAQLPKVVGPDYATEGVLPVLAPKALRELAGSGLLRQHLTVSPPDAA
jgi:hypothetical protein